MAGALVLALTSAVAACPETGGPTPAVPTPEADAGSDPATGDPGTDAGLALDAADLDAGDPDVGQPSGGVSDSGLPECVLGAACHPIVMLGFPFTDRNDTSAAPSDAVDAYACAPDVLESGGEIYYRFEVGERGVFRAVLDDEPGDAVDVDLHLLGDGGQACLVRGDAEVMRVLDPGTYWLVVDTWADEADEPLAGPFVLTATFDPLPGGACAMEPVDLPTFWRSCAPGIDCYEAVDPMDGEVRPFLRTPALGPVVKEAHLVTVADDFGGAWPTTGTDHIERHYALSQSATRYAMDRREPWAPSGEGGSRWGQGSTGRPVPVAAEAFYITMYWRRRPAPGTRMIVLEPHTGKAVVVAAGYETGPGANTAVAGVSEEVHHHLGTNHRSPLVVGFAVNPDLPLGPIDCH